MLKKVAVSAFLLFVSVTQAFAGGHGEVAHDVAASAHTDMPQDAAHAAVEHASSSGLPQLDPSSYLSQTFWLVIVFTAMLIFFSKKTIPQVSRTIENRAERINADLNTAEKLKNEVAELQKSYEDKLAQARKESYAVFLGAEKEIKDESARHAADFQKSSGKEAEKLEKNIQSARDTAMSEMSDIAADIASQATEKIIGVKTDKKTAKAVVKSINKAA